MKIQVTISILLLFAFIGCKQKNKREDIFKNVPIGHTVRFIDSIAYQIELNAGDNFTARPTLKKNEYYYDERNFRDSLGYLREYSVIERWDTGDVITNYFYYRDQLINATKRVFTQHVYQMSNYYFRKDSLFDSSVQGQLTSIRKDSILNRAYRYLDRMGDVGDKDFRKYFNKKSHPPNAIIDVIQQ